MSSIFLSGYKADRNEFSFRHESHFLPSSLCLAAIAVRPEMSGLRLVKTEHFVFLASPFKLGGHRLSPINVLFCVFSNTHPDFALMEKRERSVTEIKGRLSRRTEEEKRFVPFFCSCLNQDECTGCEERERGRERERERERKPRGLNTQKVGRLTKAASICSPQSSFRVSVSEKDCLKHFLSVH